MKYLKFYKEYKLAEIDVEDDIELSDKTIDDVLKDDFIKDIESDIEKNVVIKDKNNVYTITDWKSY
jgi:hypothetical protein